MNHHRFPFIVYACLILLALCYVALCTGSGPSIPGHDTVDQVRESGQTPVGVSPVVVASRARAPGDPVPPVKPVKLVFIHHSSGENWLADENGGLGLALMENNYFVSDTNYGWGPEAGAGRGPIGESTDIGHWWVWFRGPNAGAITQALYSESGQNSAYTRSGNDPGGMNRIVMFKSCFPNSALMGNSGDPVPAIGSNPLKGEGSGSEFHTVANAKGIYIDLLEYFKTRQDTLFVVVTAPPLSDSTYSANAREFTRWLVNDWLRDYPHRNVFVFDFYNVLTSNGGNTEVNDDGKTAGNHHYWREGRVQHTVGLRKDTSAYAQGQDDDHPTAAGNQKATAEFVPLLNYAYNRWGGTRLSLPSSGAA